MASAIQRLMVGVKSFRAQYYEHRPELIQRLATEGQKPEVLVIGCVDSRVDPALLTNAEPGELFVVRHVANLVPPYEPDGRYHGTSAALEFAILGLAVSDIVVLGHSSCGGIRAMIDGAAGNSPSWEFITPWMSLAVHHCEDVLAAHPGQNPDLAACEQASIKGSLANLMTFPFVRARVQANTLKIHGWWFDLKTGALWAYSADDDGFDKIV